MKGLKLFLAACLFVPTFDGAMAVDTPRNTTRTTQSGRGTAQMGTRKATQQTNANQRGGNVISRTASNKNVVSRTTATQSNEKSRTQTTASRNRTSVAARTAKTPNAFTRATNAIFSRVSAHPGTKSRAAATNPTRETIMQRNFSKCKTVFFECMDEFCAQKNAQLKRCACSARANEFNATQKSLDKIQDKLLDFSQHLLKVNMDPADAAVINQASEGEKAYLATKDKTASKKLLDEIAKKLNSDFDSAESGGGVGALSWSLNMDSAFDSVDSFSGISTTAKNGTALRNAALPICREMAAEVCADDDISLVENSYTMAIEQDCNTVKKAYDTQTQAARTKVLESGALLDMTRLNTYQENNADDILTCKSKMLDMLTNTSVCGNNLTKCLDISGRYINPTTGEAFLSPDLIHLSTLIIRPSSTDSWAAVPANSSFITYLNSKKKYLESATKNCQEIADDVWDTFIEDALAKIKLAQEAKLEEVRQSCTTLLSECIANANENLENFDSRAMSTFGVWTDKTANAMCERVKTSCGAIVDNTTIDPASGLLTWTDGTTQIAAMETYDRIINTCRQIGRDCIINSCKSITGNFGLCESIHGSVNRHAILARRACWNDVENCVAAASDESIEQIRALLPYNNVPSELYGAMYRFDGYAETTPDDANADNVYDVCRETCSGADNQTVECYRCRLTEQIWGNCQFEPKNAEYNPILMPQDPNKTTLLSWFAQNTHTENAANSCSISMCPAGTYDYVIGNSVVCLDGDHVVQCPGNTYRQCLALIEVSSDINNCCESGVTDSFGNCCISGTNTVRLHNDTDTYDEPICNPTGSTDMVFLGTNATTDVFCAGTIQENDSTDCSGDVCSNDTIKCVGKYITVDTSHFYNNPTCDGTDCYTISGTDPNATITTTHTNNYSMNYYIGMSNTEDDYCNAMNSPANYCKLNNPTPTWSTTSGSCPTTDPDNWLIDTMQ